MTNDTLIDIRGLSEQQSRRVQRLAKAGTYLRLARGIYVPTRHFDSQPPWEQHRLRALAIGATGTRIIGGRSAATLWGMWVVLERDNPIEHYLRRGGALVGGQRLSGRLPQSDIVTGSLASVTSIPRTIIDLARIHSFEAAFTALTWALREKQCTTAAVLKAARSAPGVKDQITRITQLIDARVESPAEAHFLAQVRDEGIVSLIPQSPIVDARGTLRRADFQIDNTRVLIEISGMGKYGITDDEKNRQLKREKQRLDALYTARYHILSYTAADVFSGYAYQDVRQRYLQERL